MHFANKHAPENTEYTQVRARIAWLDRAKIIGMLEEKKYGIIRGGNFFT
jgi:hypothetical protein